LGIILGLSPLWRVGWAKKVNRSVSGAGHVVGCFILLSCLLSTCFPLLWWFTSFLLSLFSPISSFSFFFSGEYCFRSSPVLFLMGKWQEQHWVNSSHAQTAYAKHFRHPGTPVFWTPNPNPNTVICCKKSRNTLGDSTKASRYEYIYIHIDVIHPHVLNNYNHIYIYLYNISIFINELWAHIQRDHIQKWTRVVQTAIKQWNCEAKLQKLKGNLPRRPQNILFLFLFIFLFFFIFFYFFLVFFYFFLFVSIFSMFSYVSFIFSSFSQFWKVIESIILNIFCYV